MAPINPSQLIRPPSNSQSLSEQFVIVPSESTVNVFRQVCRSLPIFHDVTHVSTLPPSGSAAVLSGAPHDASTWDSGALTHFFMSSLVVVLHALDRKHMTENTSASAAAWRRFISTRRCSFSWRSLPTFPQRAQAAATWRGFMANNLSFPAAKRKKSVDTRNRYVFIVPSFPPRNTYIILLSFR